MEPTPEARRLAIDIQEHPEWSYVEIAWRIDGLRRFYDQTGDGEYNDWPDMCNALAAKEYEIERLRRALEAAEYAIRF